LFGPSDVGYVLVLYFAQIFEFEHLVAVPVGCPKGV